MDPVTAAAITSAIVALGTKVAEGAAGKIGEDIWNKAKAAFAKVRSILGFKSEPASPTLTAEVQQALDAHPAMLSQVQAIVAEFEKCTGQALVGSISVNQGAANAVGVSNAPINQTFNFGKS